jgi:hypothetical protein
LKPLYQAGATLLQLAGKTGDQEVAAAVDWYTVHARCIVDLSILPYLHQQHEASCNYAEPLKKTLHDVNYFN